MTQQQIQKQIQKQQIQFTIQTLDGETFQVSIPLTDAEKVFQKKTNKYHYYGLDYLKDAICSSTGNANVSQQLIGEEELTIQTPLLPLVDTVITLIVKPPLTIEFIHTPTPVMYLLLGAPYTPNQIPGWNKEELSIVCYFHNYQPLYPLILNIRVIGQRRDYFKIAIADLKAANAVLRNGPILRSNPYLITVATPTYVWLRFNKDNMKIAD